jgi:hypothetical protein
MALGSINDSASAARTAAPLRAPVVGRLLGPPWLWETRARVAGAAREHAAVVAQRSALVFRWCQHQSLDGTPRSSSCCRVEPIPSIAARHLTLEVRIVLSGCEKASQNTATDDRLTRKRRAVVSGTGSRELRVGTRAPSVSTPLVFRVDKREPRCRFCNPLHSAGGAMRTARWLVATLILALVVGHTGVSRSGHNRRPYRTCD